MRTLNLRVLIISIVTIIIFSFSGCDISRRAIILYDDVYYSPKDELIIENKKETVENDYYDYFYASRIRRFHSSYFFDSYFNDYYTNMYWYNYDSYFWGISIYSRLWRYSSFHSMYWYNSPLWLYYYNFGYPYFLDYNFRYGHFWYYDFYFGRHYGNNNILNKNWIESSDLYYGPRKGFPSNIGNNKVSISKNNGIELFEQRNNINISDIKKNDLNFEKNRGSRDKTNDGIKINRQNNSGDSGSIGSSIRENHRISERPEVKTRVDILNEGVNNKRNINIYEQKERPIQIERVPQPYSSPRSTNLHRSDEYINPSYRNTIDVRDSRK